ncbi:hypothetical protein SDC9_174591 [bioreactor metagenome]|uniref:Uncharacterized protein n=1 Tax=bioreactor metagenome TaxID=1076179 RepID=A0A645GT21_9ZZZZ
MPGGHDPELGRDIHGLELRLRQAHPILLRHGLEGENLAALKKVLRQQQITRLGGCGFVGIEGDHAAAIPAFLRCGHARLAEQCLLGFGLRIGIFDGYAQCIECIQRFANGFDPIFGAQQAQLEHGHPF